MNMKIRHIFTVAYALCFGLHSLSAQNLDPTVVVNKAYEGKLFQVHKPSFEMAVPDSLTRFELDFDYLVFEKPYKGADGFSPYELDMQPVAVLKTPKKLYLDLGAGYSLHPTLDLVWSPFGKGPFRMDVYASHRSYIGKYRAFYPAALPEGTVGIERWRGADADWKGYDFMSRAGVNGSYDAASLAAGFDVSYFGLASKDLMKTRMYDALDVRLGVSSKPGSGKHYKYDVQASYRYAEDRIDHVETGIGGLGEHIVNLDASLGHVLGMAGEVVCDFDIDLAIYDNCDFASVTSQLAMAPRYVLNRERWTVEAGVRLAKVIRPNSSELVFHTRDQIVYPEVKATLSVIPDAMRLYAYIGGGNRLNTYASLLDRNHHVDPLFGIYGHGLLDVTVERVSASVGLEGRIGSGFCYDVRTGYVNYANELFDAIAVVPSGSVSDALSTDMYLPGIGYSACQKYYAAAELRLETDPFRFDGNLVYTNVWGVKDADGLFAPAALTGDFSAVYNWKRRVYAGMDCNFATDRKGSVTYFAEGSEYEARIPGYVDLGVCLEYSCNRRFSVWARGGNLLNMTIQRNPLYAEKGISGTVGICLNL